jgi:hypothetical protein
VLALPRARAPGRADGFVDSQQIGDEFAGHGQCGTVAMSAFQFAGMQRRQLRIPSRSQLSRRHTYPWSFPTGSSRSFGLSGFSTSAIRVEYDWLRARVGPDIV